MLQFLSGVDLSVLQTLYAYRSLGATFTAIGITELGEWYVIGGLTLVVFILFLYRHRFAYAQGIALSVASGAVVATLGKLLIARARPPVEYWAYQESGNSFPSAHATLSMAFFGFLLFVVWRSDLPRPVRIAVAALCAALIAMIGFTRLYLGVHYLSDVVGGYLLGGACLWLAVMTTRALEKKTSTS